MTDIHALLEQFQIGMTLQAILLIIIGYFISRIVSNSVVRALNKRLSRQQAMLLQRFIFYPLLIVFIMSAAQQLGFHITALLGATGILTVAIGIASQTSMANIVGGIFIIGEKPFEIGNIIKVNDIEGEVMSIDLLSVKIRTNDNMMIRIPNEILVKSPIINASYFPKRRIDLIFNISYKENLTQIKNILFNAATKNILSLKDPEPSFTINALGDSTINIKFSIWSTQENFNIVKNTILEEINNALAEAGIFISK